MGLEENSRRVAPAPEVVVEVKALACELPATFGLPIRRGARGAPKGMLITLLVAVALLAYANGANDNFKGVATLLGRAAEPAITDGPLVGLVSPR